MKELFDESGFAELAVRCPACGWEGAGSDTVIIDLYGLSARKEVHCPACDRFLGGLQGKPPKNRNTGDADTTDDQLSSQMG
ncbi:hypothetical protein V9K67_23460 [Paraflavisolibacter sp. H34]|uniref:hypothetical protein n=1 Tax=Huijunlia imazamoxiresistens TaxID=3127457 RepID=UPI003019FA5E